MRIENWMQRNVHVVKPLDGVFHARELMEVHRINQLPVVVNGRLVGIVTDRDVRDAMPGAIAAARAAALTHRRHVTPEEEPTVEATMSAEVMTLGPHDSVVAAARVLRRERIGALPIVDGGRLVGILTRSDVLDAFVGLSELWAPEPPHPEPRQ
jgi:acetoin utilization protein AcuB